MAHALLVNPKHRPSKRRKKRAMSALQMKYFGGGKRKRKRAANPVRALTRRKKMRRKGAAASAWYPVAAHLRNPLKKRRRRMSNPLKLPKLGNAKMVIMPGVHGAAGALALDLLYGYVPIPAQFKTGMLGQIVKGVAAIGIGMAASKVTNARVAHNMSVGALTVVFRDIARTALERYAPSVRLGDVDEASFADYTDMAGYQLNAYNPAPLAGYQLNGAPALASDAFDPTMPSMMGGGVSQPQIEPYEFT